MEAAVPTATFISTGSNTPCLIYWQGILENEVRHMVSLNDLIEELDCTLEDFLDQVTLAIDLLEEGEQEEAVEVLKGLEEDLFDFLGYEEMEEGEEEGEEEEEDEEKPKDAPAKKERK
jgi:hypothetical protein